MEGNLAIEIDGRETSSSWAGPCKMLGGAGEAEDHHEKAKGRDAAKMALDPLAVHCLLNPAGITILVIASGDVADGGDTPLI